MNILVIEDDYYSVKYMVPPLERDGHKVTVVEDTDEACEVISKRLSEFQVVILDLMLLQGNVVTDEEVLRSEEVGIALYYRIRNINGSIRIVIVSAISKPEVWKFFENDKGVVYHPKPVETNTEAYLKKIRGE